MNIAFRFEDGYIRVFNDTDEIGVVYGKFTPRTCLRIAAALLAKQELPIELSESGFEAVGVDDARVINFYDSSDPKHPWMDCVHATNARCYLPFAIDVMRWAAE